jgi:hypothetical protein
MRQFALVTIQHMYVLLRSYRTIYTMKVCDVTSALNTHHFYIKPSRVRINEASAYLAEYRIQA